MKIRLHKVPTTEQLQNRYCRFGITDELVFSDAFGNDTTFIGTLRKLNYSEPGEVNSNEYKFDVDKIERGRVQLLTALDSRNNSDLRYLKLALEHDYGFLPEEYELCV